MGLAGGLFCTQQGNGLGHHLLRTARVFHQVGQRHVGVDMGFAGVPAVKIGHHGQRAVGDLCLTGQLGFGHVGHTDHARTHAAVPVRFSQAGKLRAFNANVSAAFMQRHTMAQLLCILRGQHAAHGPPQHRCSGRAHRLGHGHMGHRAAPEKSAVAVFGQVNKLVGQHHVERLELFTQRSHR